MVDQAADRYDPVEPGRTADGLFAPSAIDYSIPGDLAMIYPAGSRPEVIIRTPTPREEWVVALDSIQAENLGQPPTTIQYRGAFYEIAAVYQHGSAHEYHLNPWPEGEIQRRVVVYSREAELARRVDELEFQRVQRRARLLGWLYPLLGFLPREVQVDLSNRWAIDPYSATWWNSLAEIAFAVYVFFMGGVVTWLLALTDAPEVAFVPNLLAVPASFWVSISPLILLDGLLRIRRLRRRGAVSGNLLLEGIWKIIL